MYLFRTDVLVLDKQFVCSFLGKPISPALIIHYLPVVLFVELRPALPHPVRTCEKTSCCCPQG